jgi:hypothetical protein
MAFARTLWPLSACIASLVGGVLAEYDVMWPVAASCLPLCVAMAAALLLHEPPRVKAHRLRANSVVSHTKVCQLLRNNVVSQRSIGRN